MRLCVGGSLAGGCWRRWGNAEFGDRGLSIKG